MKEEQMTTLSDTRRGSLEKLLMTNYSNPVWERAKEKYDVVRRSRRKDLVRLSLPAEAKKLVGEIESVRAALEPLEEKFYAIGFELEADGDINILHSGRS